MTEKFKKFTHDECEYYPCHKVDGGDADTAGFNCMFCFCPLYALGEACEGNFVYTDEGIKDCSGCVIPHSPDGYNHVMGKWHLVAALAKK